jgi:protocatechuate 3,4-dioxygenase beta subunit
MSARSSTRERAVPIALLVLVVALLAYLLWPVSQTSSTELAPALSPGADPARTIEVLTTQPTQGAEEDATGVDPAMPAGRVDLVARAAAEERARDGTEIWLTGRVVESESGEPVEGAEVELESDTWDSEVLTDAEGSFRIYTHAQGRPGLRVRKEGYAQVARPVIDLEQEVLIELDRAGRLAGRVVGPAPEDLLEGNAHLFWLSGGEKLRHTETQVDLDAGGTFEFGDLASGEYELCADVPGWGMVFEHALEVRSGATTEVVLQPNRGARMHGRVTFTGTGEPVVGAYLRASPNVPGLPPEVSERGNRETTSDAQGRYELVGLDVGEVVIQLDTTDGARARLEHVVSEEAEVYEQDFQLQAPGSLAGRVLSESGEAVGQATVQVAWDANVFSTRRDRRVEDRKGFMSTRCNSNGLFRIEGLPGGRSLRVLAFRAGEESAPAILADELSEVGRVRLASGEKREGIEIRVRETRSLVGVVVDEGGAPLEDVYVRLYRSTAEDQRKSRRLQRLKSDEQGEFELNGLLSGSYHIDLEHSEFLHRRVELEVSATGIVPEQLVVRLERSHSITGWVVDDRGDGIQRAKLSARSLHLEDPASRPDAEASTRTDAFGRFELEQLQPGTWSISARASGFERLPTPISVHTRDGGAVLIELRSDAGFQRSTVTGRVMGSDGSVPHDVEVGELRGGALDVTPGAFRLTGARSGTAHFQVSAPGFLTFKTPRLVLPPGGEVDLGWLELQPAGSLRVHVRNAKGEPVTKFKATLEPLTGSKKARKKRRLKLPLVKSRHRYKGGEERLATRAGVHSKVPLRKWRLRVEREGYEPHERVLGFTQERPQLRLEVELKRK